jgi:hypothetical protein
MKITKRQLRRIIKEERAKLNEAQMGDGTLEGWAMQDDAVDAVGDGTYEMYADSSNGIEELDFIIERLKEVYALGGGVSMIKIEAGMHDWRNKAPGV